MQKIKMFVKVSYFLAVILLLCFPMFSLVPASPTINPKEVGNLEEPIDSFSATTTSRKNTMDNNQEVSDKYYFISPTEKHQESIKEENSKAIMSESLLSLLSTTPKDQWEEKTVRLIVVYDKKVSPTLRFSSNSMYGVKMLKSLPIVYIKATLNEAQRLMTLRGIKGVYLDRYIQFIDPSWKNTESMTETYPSEAYIGARYLQKLGINGSGIKIAIIDTGIDKTHPDLDDMDNDPSTNDPKIIAEQSFVDFDFDGTNDTDDSDQVGHGTHCAGIAAANGLLKGVAPGAYLMNARALDARGWAYVSWVVNAIDWAVNNGADIISMSIGWAPSDVIALLNEASNNAWERGTMVVVAAGNSGPSLTTISSPGMASRALTVGASNILNLTTNWSSRGPSTNNVIDPDVLAPGEDIFSTVPQNGYKAYSGTSM
ncbi:MAG: hypothetical protein DRI92_05960, partial [Aquificota bacterium]